MAANIVLVHDDFPGSHNNSPAGCRYDAALFKDTMTAIDALKATHQIEILITRVFTIPTRATTALRWRAFRG